MCSIVLVRHWRPDVPLVLAANRDERLDRAADAPLLLRADPPVWGGRDRLAGGTWLAVDPVGRRVVAVTNRHVGEADAGRDPARRSRGELPVLLLSSPADPADLLAGLHADDYNPVNVLAVTPAVALWSTLTTTVRLDAGVHALTVQDLDDPTSAKTLRLLDGARTAAREAAGVDDLRDRLAALLASHETAADGTPESAPCIHGDEYGTVSASTVVVDAAGVQLRYAPGRPCTTPFGLVDMRK